MGALCNIEIPLLSSFLYLLGETGNDSFESPFEFKASSLSRPMQLAPRTLPDGEFDWGGTSVKG